MSLLLRPHLTYGEGPHGYLFRLAEANGLGLADLVDLGVHFDVHALERLGCLQEQSFGIEAIAYAKALESKLVLSPQSWNRTVARFCPECLREKGHWQFGWEILFFDACPVHGTWLLDRCPACYQYMSWQRPELLRCSCGAFLASHRAVPCPDSVARLSMALAHCVVPNGTEEPIPITEATGLAQLQRVIRLLGAYGDSVAVRKPQKIIGVSRMDVSWHLTSLAAEIIDQWPQSFFAMLHRMEDSPSTVGAGRLGGRFGHFYSLLYRGVPDPEFDFLRRAFEEFVAEHWRGSFGGRNRRLISNLPRQMAWIPAKHARQILGVSQRRLQALIATGVMSSELRLGQSGRGFLFIRRADVEALADHAKEAVVDLVTAASLLGLKKRRAASLIPLLIPGVRTLGQVGCTWKISRVLIGRILSVGQALPVRPPLQEGEICLGHVVRYWSWSDGVLADCIEACLKGDLLPVAYARGSQGINGLLFQPDALKAWYASRPRGPASYSIPEVAERLSIKQEVAYFLVRKNLIKAERARAGRKAMSRVSVQGLADFEREYVFGRDLAAQLEMSPRALADKLAHLGVYAVSGPGADGGRQLIFCRNGELNNAISLLADWQSKFRMKRHCESLRTCASSQREKISQHET